MSQRESLVLGSDMLVELSNLRDAATDALLEGATVTGQVLDSAGVPVVDVSNPINFTEVSGRKGIYRGVIEAAAAYSAGDDVTIKVTAVKSGTTRIFTILATVVEVL